MHGRLYPAVCARSYKSCMLLNRHVFCGIYYGCLNTGGDLWWAVCCVVFDQQSVAHASALYLSCWPCRSLLSHCKAWTLGYCMPNFLGFLVCYQKTAGQLGSTCSGNTSHIGIMGLTARLEKGPGNLHPCASALECRTQCECSVCLAQARLYLSLFDKL